MITAFWRRATLIMTVVVAQYPTWSLMAGAQVVPDRTLPVPSEVQPNNTTNIITGGTPAGGNLFHSFQEFSLPTGSNAYFNNSLDIQNIITRVTGGKLSQIDGLIQANGGANLFLINPTGIIFGANARLNIGGSFLATTADSIVFPNEIYFSGTNPNVDNHGGEPLLSVNMPLGLQFGTDAAPIKVEGPGATPPDSSIISLDTDGIISRLPELVQGEINFQEEFLASPEGLRVEPGKTLALVGGDITVTGGLLKARSGQIDLGSVGAGSFVSLIPNEIGFTLGYEAVNTYQDIAISQKSWLITSGNGAGDIQLTGRSIGFFNGSQTEASTLGEAPGGQIIINASEAVALTGAGDSMPVIGASTFTRGNAGDVIIKTGQLQIKDGSVLGAQTFASGNGGNIMINASESVAVTGTSPDGQFPSLIGARSLAAGNGGSVQIETGKIDITQGGLIGVETLGDGNAGTIDLKATASVEIRGIAAQGQFFSWLAANTAGAGNGGNIVVATPRFVLSDGASVAIGTEGTGNAGSVKITGAKEVILDGYADNEISLSGIVAPASDVGNGGNIVIEAERVFLRNGVVVAVGTTGEGNAGNIDIRAAEAVEISGIAPNGENSSGLAAETIGDGDAGNVNIVTEFLRLSDGATINVNGTATGNPGNIEVTADYLSLENQAGMLATAATGRGGNINLQVRDVRLRFGSEISAAGSSIGNITLEGNINLQAETLVLLENSRIITSASNPSGGSNIAITPLNGEQLLVFQSPDSIINARGELTITDNFVVQPVAFPLVKLVNVEGLISRNFCQQRKDSQFIMTGRGGLPPTPFEAITSGASVVEWAGVRDGERRIGGNPVPINQGKVIVNPPIVEATGWTVAADGTVVLTADLIGTNGMGIFANGCAALGEK